MAGTGAGPAAAGLAERAAGAVRLAVAAGRRATAADGGGRAGPEEALRAGLAAAFPADAVCGGTAGAPPGPAGPRWVLGTPPAPGAPDAAVRIAYEDARGPAVGVLHLPAAGRTVVAVRGRGCRLLAGDAGDPAGGRAARAGARTELTGARTLTDGPAGWPEPLLTALHRRVALVASGGGAAEVVAGRADAWVSAGPLAYGDRAPLPVLAGEAGARVTDLAGRPVLTGDGSALVTGGPLHGPFLALLAEAAGHEPKPVVSDPCPGWAAEGAALAERIRALLGPSALRAEHIGSTAVPGLAAKPVFDLQVSVADLAAADREFGGPLAGAGFVRGPYEHDHVPAGCGDGPERWAKRFWARRGGPGPDVNLHVRRAGAPNERLALLFRDWFRAHPEAVPAYARFKRELAQRVPDLGAYTEIKDPVVDLVVGVAEAWAARAGWRP
ncbi:GrpB family protein [Streptomyces sp. RS10V-4]|uniref:inositol monophosphatase family protein n=1 Tax=Streptomyces rhizoryzae TaxID=2932493 RepID=UPI002003630D|nr:inositol monophosphatase family protein [Streptomyces rhizoryzae]MCK7624688.1 GrpB family protein [Streptomyces rhizoryzae]